VGVYEHVTSQPGNERTGIPIVCPVQPRPCLRLDTVCGAQNFRTGRTRALHDKTTQLRRATVYQLPPDILQLKISSRIWLLYSCRVEFIYPGTLIPEPDVQISDPGKP